MAQRPPEEVEFGVEKYRDGRVAIVLEAEMIAKGRRVGRGRELYLMSLDHALAHARAIIATVNELKAGIPLPPGKPR